MQPVPSIDHDLFPEDPSKEIFQVHFSLSKDIDAADPEESACNTIEGRIDCLVDDDTNVQVGELKLYNFRLDVAGELGLDYFDLFDACSEETNNLYDALFDEDEFKLGLDDHCPIWTVLHIKRLELDERCRGFRLGEKVFQTIIQTFSDDYTLITSKPFPLQWENLFDKEIPEIKADKQKVIRFWESVGFVPIQETDFYMCQPGLDYKALR